MLSIAPPQGIFIRLLAYLGKMTYTIRTYSMFKKEISVRYERTSGTRFKTSQETKELINIKKTLLKLEKT